MEMMFHPAAWRYGYYLFSGSRFYKDTNNYIFLKNMSNIPIANGCSFKALIIKLTRPFINITMIETSVLLVV
jgi:hypothetical protein